MRGLHVSKQPIVIISTIVVTIQSDACLMSVTQVNALKRGLVYEGIGHNPDTCWSPCADKKAVTRPHT